MPVVECGQAAVLSQERSFLISGKSRTKRGIRKIERLARTDAEVFLGSHQTATELIFQLSLSPDPREFLRRVTNEIPQLDHDAMCVDQGPVHIKCEYCRHLRLSGR